VGRTATQRKSVRNAHTTLQRRSDAVRRGHLAVNPVDAVDPPACDESVERTAWTAPRCARSWTWPPAIDSPRSGVSRSPPDSARGGLLGPAWDEVDQASVCVRRQVLLRLRAVQARAGCSSGPHSRSGVPARHSYAELALSSGVRLVVVSRTLGHSSSAFTADQYSHCSDEAAAEADRIGSVRCYADSSREILGKCKGAGIAGPLLALVDLVAGTGFEPVTSGL
jgi:hypothetical protein